MRDQYLDRMDIERERGITIKAQNVRIPWVPKTGKHAGEEIVMHLWLTPPGHVDFTYEVSRALEACEGAILLVDAAQGIEAQTLANLYMAIEKDLEIIPVLNKIDLPAADPNAMRANAQIIGCRAFRCASRFRQNWARGRGADGPGGRESSGPAGEP